MNLYEEVHQRHRELGPIIKHLSANQQNELRNQWSDEVYQTKDNELKRLQNRLNQLIGLRERTEGTVEVTRQRYEENKKRWTELTLRKEQVLSKIHPYSLIDYESMQIKQHQAELLLKELETQITLIGGQLEDTQNIINVTEAREAEVLNSPDSLKELELELQELAKDLDFSLRLNECPYEASYRGLQTLTARLSELTTETIDLIDSDYRHWTERYQVKQKECHQLADQLTTEYMMFQKAEIDAKSMLTCPSCHHEFSPTVPMGALNQLKRQYQTTEDALRLGEKELASVKEELQAATLNKDRLTHINTLLTRETALVPLLDRLKKEGYLDKLKNQLKNRLQYLCDQLVAQEQYRIKANHCQMMVQRETILASITTGSLDQLRQKAIELDKSYMAIKCHQERQESELATLKSLLRLMKDGQHLLIEETRYKEQDDKLNAAYRQAIEQTGYEADYRLALEQQNDLQKQLNHQGHAKSILNKIETELNALLKEQQYAKGIIDVLSPKVGYIAELFSQHYNLIIRSMNRVIQTIISYPFELMELPTDTDQSTLDYRFKVSINHESVIDDVSLCSGGQREVIDLAFRLVALDTLGLRDHVLYLDEFGHAMDAVHRKTAYELIYQELIHDKFTQAFIATHHMDVAGSFQTDTTVLCQQNINIPPNLNLNQATSFTY